MVYQDKLLSFPMKVYIKIYSSNFYYIKSIQICKYIQCKDFKWSLVKKIFLEPYFMLYGEVYAPDIDRMYFLKNKLFLI